MESFKANETNSIALTNTYKGARQPTDLNDASAINKSRHDFIQLFDCPEFNRRISIPILCRNKTFCCHKDKK